MFSWAGSEGFVVVVAVRECAHVSPLNMVKRHVSSRSALRRPVSIPVQPQLHDVCLFSHITSIENQHYSVSSGLGCYAYGIWSKRNYSAHCSCLKDYEHYTRPYLRLLTAKAERSMSAVIFGQSFRRVMTVALGENINACITTC